MRPADKAWLALGAGVLIWDVTCAPGEMLSEASERYAKHHPLIAYAVVASVALHLIHKLPAQIDPVHLVGMMLRELRWTLVRCRPRSTPGSSTAAPAPAR